MPRRRSNTRISLPATFLSIAALFAIAAHGFAAEKKPSVQAEKDEPKHDDTVASMTARFLKQPNKESFTALQNRVVADHSYDQTSRGLEEMIDLYKQKHYQAALDRFKACMPDQLLSSQGHFYAARCYEELGQKEQRKTELAFTRACLQGLMATGDGSAKRPIVVTHVTDEYDLLAAPLHAESKSQSLVQKKGRWYDVLECTSGKTYWFDVTLTFGRGRAAGTATASSAKTAAGATAAKPTAATSIQLAGNQASVPVEQPAPIQPIESKAKLATAAYNRGVSSVVRHNYSQAIAELEEAIRQDPLSPDAYLERGIAFLECRMYKEAYDDFNDAIRLRSDYALAFYERGLCLRLQGEKSRWDDAIVNFSESIRLSPGDYLSWRNRAMIWFAKGDYRKAIADNGEAIRLRPDDAMSYSNRGFACESAGDFAKAVADFNQAIRLWPRFAEAYAGRGIAWVGRGEFDLAIADLDEAIRLKPDYAAAYAYRGKAFAQKSDEKRAQADEAQAALLRAKP